jgi:hypothetical protein
MARARQHYRPEVEAKKLTVTESFITAENIEDLFKKDSVPEEFDFLSIDIDRNDYYVALSQDGWARLVARAAASDYPKDSRPWFGA